MKIQQVTDHQISQIISHHHPQVTFDDFIAFNWSYLFYHQKMNRSLTHKSTGKKATTPNKLSPAHTPITSSSSALYFCHYKNAMYMGGIKLFKKDGKGILIHDCGLSVITNYLNDVMHGHNIFFAQHCLLSAQYVKGKITDCVYRTDGYMAHLYYNSDGQLDGKCKLFNFITKTVTYANFRKGVMIVKEEESDFTLLNKVFELAEYEFMIGRVHTSALKYDIKKANNIEGQKYGNKLTIGFEKGGLINGLSFTLIFRGSHGGYNPQTHRNEDEFELRVIERGYMANSHLNGFGQKLFKNGNLYIGEFKNGIFEGNGILRNTAKKNWVSGYFQKGNLVDLLEYNNQGEEKKFDRIVQAMHERKTNWINNEIVLFDMNIFDQDVEKILSFNPDSAVKSLQQRKQDVLKKIQDNFLCEPNSLPSFLETAKADLKMFGKDKENEQVKRFVHSFIPEVQKTRLNLTDLNTMQDGYQLSASRRSPTSIRKSKIFDRSKSFDRYLKVDTSAKGRIGKSPDPKKKIFNLSTAPSKAKRREIVNEQSSIEVTPHKQQENMKESLHLGDSSENSQVNNTHKERSFNKNEEKSIGKSKIFKYLQNQTEEIAPKFIYTKIDTIKDSEKKKRLGNEYHS